MKRERRIGCSPLVEMTPRERAEAVAALILQDLDPDQLVALLIEQFAQVEAEATRKVLSAAERLAEREAA